MHRFAPTVFLAMGICFAACGTASEAAAPEAASSEATTTTTAATPPAVSNSEQPVSELPEWVNALPFEIDTTTLAQAPEALAFASDFEDPGQNYRLSASPDWDLVDTTDLAGPAVAEWTVTEDGLVRVLATAGPTWPGNFADVVENTRIEVLYVDDTTALTTETRTESGTDITVIQLLKHEIYRTAMLQLSFPQDQASTQLSAALPYMLTFERTPYSGTVEGRSTREEQLSWQRQLEEVTPLHPNPEEGAICLADGFASERITSQIAALSTVDPLTSEDLTELMALSNLWADNEEVAVFCGLPINSLGTPTE